MKRLFLATVLFTLAILSGGKAMAQFAGGSGIQNDPYLIATAEQFNKMGENQDSSKYYKQIANLTFGGQDTAFKAIEFSGHYDGGGHWITADRTQNTALFGQLSGSVKNVTLFGIAVQTTQSSGILAESLTNNRLDSILVAGCSLSVESNNPVLSAGILASSSHTSTIFFCGVDNCSISFNPGTWTGEVGGLVGISHGGCTFEYSSFSGKIDLYGSNSNRYASGLIGRADGSSVKACMVSDGYVNVAENAYTDTGNINANICGLVYSAGNPHTAIRNSAIESNFALKLMGNPVHNNQNVNEISNSTDTSKCATIFSDVNPENIPQTVVYLNEGLTPPAFRVSNGQIVHATTPEMNFTNGRWESIVSGRFDRANTWVRTGDATPPEYIINRYHKVSIEQGVTLPANINIMVKYAGSLINKTDNAVTASMENSLSHGWRLIGFPVQGKSAIAPLAADDAPDIWALAFDYPNNKWNENNFLHYNDDQKDSIEAGNGIMAYCDFNYTPITTGLTVNDNLRVTNPVTGTDNDGRWMALANPYPATITTADIKAQTQGQFIYVYTLNTWHYENIDKLHSGTGFMVNMPEGHSIVFRKNMIDGYGTTTGTKSTPAKRDFLTVSVSTDGYKVPVMFAKNEAAREDYDIFDANKLFGDGSVAEPYLLCNGINLCKEEVNSLPYTATMNIKSGEARSVEIIADNIPEGYSLSLLDGEEEIAMNQGDTYTVEIASGENADRFKLKIGEKNVSITEIEAAEELSIRNNNRNIIIEGGKNIRAEVYNTLGQKVYETTARNFNIEGVAAGAYVIKVQSGKAVQSQKVIIR